jgi:hypothetical protein
MARPAFGFDDPYRGGNLAPSRGRYALAIFVEMESAFFRDCSGLRPVHFDQLACSASQLGIAGRLGHESSPGYCST